MHVKISKFQEHEKDTLIGFFDVELAGQGIAIKGLGVHGDGDRYWISWPKLDKHPGARAKSIVGFSSDRLRKLWENAILAELQKSGHIGLFK